MELFNRLGKLVSFFLVGDLLLGANLLFKFLSHIYVFLRGTILTNNKINVFFK